MFNINAATANKLPQNVQDNIRNTKIVNGVSFKVYASANLSHLRRIYHGLFIHYEMGGQVVVLSQEDWLNYQSFKLASMFPMESLAVFEEFLNKIVLIKSKAASQIASELTTTALNPN